MQQREKEMSGRRVVVPWPHLFRKVIERLGVILQFHAKLA